MINRKIAISGMSIVVALGMMASATFAVFTSAASSNGNTFGSGTLTLTINGVGGSASTPVIAVSGKAPGEFVVGGLNLVNTGSVNAGSTKITGIAVTGDSDLAGKLTAQFYNDVNEDGALDGGDTLIPGASGHLTDNWSNVPLGFGLATSTPHRVLMKVTFDADADSTLQGKTATFGVTFQASQ